jgi:3-methyl-2-oxobutanoate hydroxymethyltransferase
VLADLPYQARSGSVSQTVAWCKQFRDRTGCDAVKIEVAAEDAPLVSAVRDAGIPVVAHLGLRPQFVDPGAGYRAQGRDADSAVALLDAARRLERAGAAMLLLEAVASEVAREITARASIPVIGCVAGPYCDGTVVVLHDMLGLGGGHPPRAVKQYAALAETMSDAFARYVSEIRAGLFPVDEDAIHMKPGEFEKLVGRKPSPRPNPE